MLIAKIMLNLNKFLNLIILLINKNKKISILIINKYNLNSGNNFSKIKRKSNSLN